MEGGLQNLQDLNLDHNNITSFAALVTLPALIVLRLNHNKVDGCGSWSGLEGQGTPDAPALRIVSPLEVLLLGFNKVGHIDALGLQQFPRLRVLHLGNNLSSLQGLGACPSLRELVLNKNRIRQLEAVSYQDCQICTNYTCRKMACEAYSISLGWSASSPCT